MKYLINLWDRIKNLFRKKKKEAEKDDGVMAQFRDIKGMTLFELCRDTGKLSKVNIEIIDGKKGFRNNEGSVYLYSLNRRNAKRNLSQQGFVVVE